MKKKVVFFILILSLFLTSCQTGSSLIDSTTEAGVETEKLTEELVIIEETGAASREDGEEDNTIAERESAVAPEPEESTGPETVTTVGEDDAQGENQFPQHTEIMVKAAEEVVQYMDTYSTILVDLDGDGNDEKLMVVMEEELLFGNSRPFIYPAVLINDHYFTKEDVNGLYAENPYTKFFYLMDLDTTDPWTEIALPEAGPSGDPRTTFFRYHDGELVYIGFVPNVLWIEEDGTMDSVVLGDGKYIGRARLDIIQTAVAEKTWGLVNGTDFNASIEEVIPEYYEFRMRSDLEYWCSVIQELPVYKEMIADADQIVNLPVGIKIDFRRYYPEGGWIEIISAEEETLGWLKVEQERGGEMVLPGNFAKWPGLHYYIEGLNTAD